jgi:hypothetical protein
LPAVDGTYAFIYSSATKGNVGGITNRQGTVIIQIGGSTISTIQTANSTGASTNSEQYIVARTNGVWKIFGYVPTAGNSNTASSITTADLAEWIKTVGQKPQAGEIVSTASDTTTVTRSSRAYDTHAVGVVSTAPNTVYGEQTDSSVPLALAGRIPVIVTTKNGQISTGDYVTTSSYAGVGQLATKAGATVGKALESTSGWSSSNCPIVPSIASIDWPSDDGTNQSYPCFKVSDGQGSYYIVGKIMMLANISTTTGQSVWNNIPSLDSGSTNGLTTDQNQTLLDQLLSDRQAVTTDAANQSSISTDHLVAGLDIVTPLLTAEQVNTAKFGVGAAGLDFVGSGGSKLAGLDASGVFTAQGLVSDGALTITGPAEFKGTSLFDQLVTFGAAVQFNGDVSFNGLAHFSNNAGGYATIHTGQSTVHVTFARAYDSAPIVSVTPGNGQYTQYSTNNVTSTGFDIVLPTAASSDQQFSWIALSVTNPTTAQ